MARTHDLPRSGRGATLGQAAEAPRSVTAIAKRRLHRGDAVQIEIDHLLKCRRRGTVAQAFRQSFETCGTLGLDCEHLGQRVVSAFGPAAPRRQGRLDGDGWLLCLLARAVDLMSVSGLGEPGREVRPELHLGPAKGGAFGTSQSVFVIAG